MNEGKQFVSVRVARLATRTIYKLVFIGSYVAAIVLGVLDFVLELTGLPSEWISLQFDVNVGGFNLLGGFLGLIFLPLSAAVWAGVAALLFGSFIALGLYLWHFLEPVNIRYMMLDATGEVHGMQKRPAMLSE